jgi:hypothetical protein
MLSHRLRAAWAAVVAGSLLGAAACSDDGGQEGAGPETTVDGTVTSGGPSALVPAVPPPSPSGTGVVVVGGASSTFTVSACRLEPDPAAPAGARALLQLEGAGTTSAGVPFTIEVQRFATGTDVVTFTDTVTYTDAARILQAQRVEVAGQVTDLRDAEATTALLRPRSDGVSGAGLAGGPGDIGDDDGVIGLALDATC